MASKSASIASQRERSWVRPPVTRGLSALSRSPCLHGFPPGIPVSIESTQVRLAVEAQSDLPPDLEISMSDLLG